MSAPEALLLLNIGATEIFLVLVLFVLLFGVDKVPEIARTVGRWQGQLNRMRKQLAEEVKTPVERERDALFAFEKQREQQIRQTAPVYQEEMRLREAARMLGIEGADTMDIPRLQREVQAAAGGGREPPGSGGGGPG